MGAFSVFPNTFANRPLLGSSEELRGLVPVNNVPPSLDVVSAHVLIFQIIRVLPDVQAKNSLAVAREQIRSVLVRCRVDGQFSISDHKPRPARTKAAQPSGRKFLLKTGKRSERRVDRRRKISLGLPASAFFS